MSPYYTITRVRRSSPLTSVLLAVFPLCLIAWDLIYPVSVAETGWVSALAGLAILAVCAIWVNSLNSRYSSNLSFQLPGLYLLLALSLPGSVYLSNEHFAALLILAVVTLMCRYKQESHRSDLVFCMVFISAVASSLFPPLLPALLLLILTGIIYSDRKSSFLIILLLSTLIGIAAGCGCSYLFHGPETMSARWASYWSALSTPLRGGGSSSWQQIAMLSMMIAGNVVSIILFLLNRRHLRREESRLLNTTALATATTGVLLTVYYIGCSLWPLVLLPVMAPLSQVIFNLRDEGRGVLLMVFVLIYGLLAVALRILPFIG